MGLFTVSNDSLTKQLDYQIVRKYWNKLAERPKNEGSQTVTKCHELKLLAQKILKA
jgi:hypothetical protein